MLPGSLKNNVLINFTGPNVVDVLSDISAKYGVVSADETSNNFIFACNAYYFQCLLK